MICIRLLYDPISVQSTCVLVLIRYGEPVSKINSSSSDRGLYPSRAKLKPSFQICFMSLLLPFGFLATQKIVVPYFMCWVLPAVSQRVNMKSGGSLFIHALFLIDFLIQ